MTGLSRWTGMVVWTVGALCLLAGVASAAGTGVLFITSNPPGVEVTVDGKRVGVTPVTVSGVEAGEHTVAVVSDLYESQQAKVTVRADSLVPVPFSLKEGKGSLILTSDMVGLRIILDGKDVGVVEEGKPFTASGLVVGPHAVRLVGPFYSVDRMFEITKGGTAEVDIPGGNAVGSLRVSSTIKADGLLINGFAVAEGAPPYKVANIPPGDYLVQVQTTPVPYLSKVTVQAGRVAEVDLDASRDVGRLIITSSITLAPEVRIDGVVVGNAIPLTLDGIVKGPHTIEVMGKPHTREFVAGESPTSMGRAQVWVTAGGTTTVDVSGDKIKENTPDCPSGMVKIPRGVVEGEFWFKEWDSLTHPANSQPGVAAFQMAGRGKTLDLSAGGVNLSIQSVNGRPNAVGSRRDLTTDPIAQHTAYFTASVPMDYCIDIYEYPNVAGVKPQELGFFDAARRCDAQGKRLCTSVEWVKACSGPEKRLYPYGDSYQPARCNTIDNPRSRGIAPAGSFANCVNGYGLYDMSGNVAEWTVADVDYAITPRSPEDDRILSTPALVYTAALKYDSFSEDANSPKLDYRGGSWLSSDWEASCRAMPSLVGAYVGTDDRPSFTEQLMQAWSGLDPKTDLKIAQSMLSSFQKSWNEGTWQSETGKLYSGGMIRGNADYVQALDNVAYQILRALGRSTHGGGAGGGMGGSMGGAPMAGGPMGAGSAGGGRGGPMMGGPMAAGGSGPMMGGPMGPGGAGSMMGGPGGGGGGGSQAPAGTTVQRGTGPDARYLGSARLRGFRCCMFAHGQSNAPETAQPGTMGLGGPQGPMGPGGAGAGGLLTGPSSGGS